MLPKLFRKSPLTTREFFSIVVVSMLFFLSRYFIASQDFALREKARRIPGTPVLYLHRAAPTLEKPSDMSAETADQSVTDR